MPNWRATRGWSGGLVLLVLSFVLGGIGAVSIAPDRSAAAVGDSWVYEVTYGSETTYWTDTVVAEEVNSGVMCAKTETTFSSNPVRMAKGVEITIKESRGWRALSDGDFRYREQKVTAYSGWAVVDSSITLSAYTAGHGKPFVLGETWSYHEHVQPSLGGAYDYDYTAVVADALETVSVPAGTFDCYKVTHTDQATPSRTFTEWWDASGTFDQAPVKTVDDANFEARQTMELTSYPSAEPTVTTEAATGVTSEQVILNGTLESLGAASSVSVSFEWGETFAYGNETAPEAMTSAGPFSAGIAGLAPGQTYHFRAKAVGDGTSYGADRTFVATPCGSRTWHFTAASADGEPFAIDGDHYIKYNKYMSTSIPAGSETSVLIGYREGDGFGLWDDNDDAWWYADSAAGAEIAMSNDGWQASIVYSSSPDNIDGIIGELTVMVLKVNNQGQPGVVLMGEQTKPVPAGQDHAELFFDSITGPGSTDFDPGAGDRLAVRLLGSIDDYETCGFLCGDWADRMYVHFNSPSADSTLTTPCSDPGYPVPEIPTIVLTCIGLLGLGGYVWLRRRRVAPEVT